MNKAICPLVVASTIEDYLDPKVNDQSAHNDCRDEEKRSARYRPGEEPIFAKEKS